METRRPTSPAAEEILGGYFPVLDHGFMALVDYMGGDEDVERAARVSYGYGTRRVSRTRGLIRYLRRHHHTTPSEMVELKFHCCMPMFVARQWVRHRTACLAEGTDIHFDLPGGMARRGGRLYTLPIDEIWRRFQPTRNRSRPDGRGDPFFRRDRLRAMPLRQWDEDELRIGHTRIADVFRNGRKPVFRMVLADGKAIEATTDHRFLFAEGWKSLRQATGLEERGGRAVWDRGDHYLYVDGGEAESPAVQRDAERWRERHRRRGLRFEALAGAAGAGLRRPAHRELAVVERLGGPSVKAAWQPRPRIPWNEATVARLVRIERFEYAGEKETYDLEVEGPHHNFIANGIVTHNSVNEYSGRYSLMPLLFYRPESEQFAAQSRANRQGRSTPLPERIYRAAVERWERTRAEAAGSYEWLLGENVARELARIDLPLSTYTQWYWKIDLHNLLHFLTLRVDPHAQWEIRAYGRVIAGMMRRVAPLTYEAWVDYDLMGARLSAGELEVVRHFLRPATGTAGEGGVEARPGAGPLDGERLREAGLSGREIRELLAKLEPAERPDFSLDLSRMKQAEAVRGEMEEAVPEVDRRADRGS